ncbi:MAG: hypothetical protein M1835_002230, partial [Candelina submexicana]
MHFSTLLVQTTIIFGSLGFSNPIAEDEPKPPQETKILAQRLAVAPPVVKPPEPKPSQYPYGTPDLNEFQYRDWKANDQTDIANAKKIHQAFRDWKSLALAGKSQATENGEIFERWFKKNDHKRVLAVFDRMITPAGDPNPEAQARIADLINEQKDFDSRCSKNTCSAHWDEIGKAGTGVHIKDWVRKPKECVDLPPEKSIINANSYAFFAMNAYYNAKCHGNNIGPPVSTSDDHDEIDD